MGNEREIGFSHGKSANFYHETLQTKTDDILGFIALGHIETVGDLKQLKRNNDPLSTYMSLASRSALSTPFQHIGQGMCCIDI